MTERVIIFSVAPLWSPHFETELELAASHREQGDEVCIVACQGVLQSCLANPDHRRLRCMECRSRFRSGLRAIDWPDSAWLALEAPQSVRSPVSQPDTLDELREIEIDGFDIGRGVASSIVSLIRDSAPNLRRYRELVQRVLTASMQAFLGAQKAISDFMPTRVYVFNGRFASTAPLVEASERAGIPFTTHEAGYGLGTFVTTEARSVHSLDATKRRFREAWERAVLSGAVEEATAAGSAFFEGRRWGGSGAPVSEYDFTAHQVDGKLPSELRGRPTVAIFNSSEDEFASLTEYQQEFYADQMDALEQIVMDERLGQVMIVVRSHPNLIGLANDQTRRLEALSERANVRVVAPEEPIDTYALMEAASAVLTFGSTTGIEAVYWGRPSILVGRAAYEDLGVVRPRDHDEVISMILDPPAVSDPLNAIQFGYGIRAGSAQFRFFEQSDFREGAFAGVEVKASLPLVLLRRLRNLTRRVIETPGQRLNILLDAARPFVARPGSRSSRNGGFPHGN